MFIVTLYILYTKVEDYFFQCVLSMQSNLSKISLIVSSSWLIGHSHCSIHLIHPTKMIMVRHLEKKTFFLVFLPVTWPTKGTRENIPTQEKYATKAFWTGCLSGTLQKVHAQFSYCKYESKINILLYSFRKLTRNAWVET